jgi:hypothetical protein
MQHKANADMAEASNRVIRRTAAGSKHRDRELRLCLILNGMQNAKAPFGLEELKFNSHHINVPSNA